MLPPAADRLAPRPLRLALYAAAVSVLLWLTLAPAKDLPPEHMWDKAEHALGWATLTGLGLYLSPRRPRAITAFSLGLGAVVEVLQGALPFGRDADWKDLVADSIGVALALGVWWLVRRNRRP